MDIKTKLDLLEKIYNIFDSFISDIDSACTEKCNDCCSQDVIITTLEAYQISNFLIENKKEHFFDIIEEQINKAHYQPQITINELAKLCKNNEEIKDDIRQSSNEKCPLLDNEKCTIYPIRPLSCRSLISTIKCDENGFATIDPFVISVSNMFQQIIENLDKKGCTGNLIDVVHIMKSSENRLKYENDDLYMQPLLKNHFSDSLLVPSEHIEKIKPIYRSLGNIFNQL